MRRSALALLVMTALLPLPATAATITVRPGQTLSDIADDYGVSVRQLMQMNGIRDSNHVESGSRLTVPGPQVSAGLGRHRVSPGETLSTIASRYRVSSRDLMVVNNIGNANHVEVGQTLKLPSNAVIAKAKPKPAPIRVVPGASQHTVGRGQTLTQIARAYRLPVATLIDLNAINDPDNVKVGATLYLKSPDQPLSSSSLNTSSQLATSSSSASSIPARTPVEREPAPSTRTRQQQPAATKTAAVTTTVVKQKPAVKKQPVAKKQLVASTTVVAKGADWRSYGPLKVDWANWQTMGDSRVVPTLNAAGQPLYLAVNCGAQKINVTGADGSWKAWAAPSSRFEKDLVKDRCQATG